MELYEIWTLIKWVVILVVGTFLTLSMTACGVTSSVGHGTFGQADIHLSATEQGMQAFGDTLNALVITGKSAPNTATEYGELRKLQDDNRTRRKIYKIQRPKNKNIQK